MEEEDYLGNHQFVRALLVGSHSAGATKGHQFRGRTGEKRSPRRRASPQRDWPDGRGPDPFLGPTTPNAGGRLAGPAFVPAGPLYSPAGRRDQHPNTSSAPSTIRRAPDGTSEQVLAEKKFAHLLEVEGPTKWNARPARHAHRPAATPSSYALGRGSRGGPRVFVRSRPAGREKDAGERNLAPRENPGRPEVNPQSAGGTEYPDAASAGYAVPPPQSDGHPPSFCVPRRPSSACWRRSTKNPQANSSGRAKT